MKPWKAVLFFGLITFSTVYGAAAATNKKGSTAYTTAPFVLKGDKVPVGFKGNDIKAIYDALNKRMQKLKQKGEFETTAAFAERIASEERRPFLASLSISDDMAVVLTPGITTYNADNKELSVELNHGFIRVYSKFLVRVLSNQESEYIAQNALGARATVWKELESHAVLEAKNISQFDLDEFEVKPYEFSSTTEATTGAIIRDISADAARRTKGHVNALCVFNLVEPYTDNLYRRDSPTLTNRFDTTRIENIVIVKVKEFIFYDNTTGTILKRFTPRPGQ